MKSEKNLFELLFCGQLLKTRELVLGGQGHRSEVLVAFNGSLARIFHIRLAGS